MPAGLKVITGALGLVAWVSISAAGGGMYAQNQTSPPIAKNEVGLVVGASEVPSVGLQDGSRVNLNSSLALGIEYDRLLVGRRTALYGGVDFLASPFDVKVSYPPANISPQYAYLFLTPHVRIKFNAGGTLQPWLLFGGGYANSSPAPPRVGNVDVSGVGSTGTLEFGGGVDTKPIIRLKGLPVINKLPIGGRLEVRDFYSGQPNYGLTSSGSRQNTVAFTGGLLLRF